MKRLFFLFVVFLLLAFSNVHGAPIWFCDPSILVLNYLVVSFEYCNLNFLIIDRIFLWNRNPKVQLLLSPC